MSEIYTYVWIYWINVRERETEREFTEERQLNAWAGFLKFAIFHKSSHSANFHTEYWST